MARSHYNTKKRQKELDGKKKQEEKRQAKQSKKIAEVIELERNHPDEIENIKAQKLDNQSYNTGVRMVLKSEISPTYLDKIGA